MSSIHAPFQKTRQGNEDVRYQLWVKMTTLFFSVLLYHSQSHFRVTQSISQTHRCILASLERIFLQRTRTQYIGAIPCICRPFNAFPFLLGLHGPWLILHSLWTIRRRKILSLPLCASQRAVTSMRFPFLAVLLTSDSP